MKNLPNRCPNPLCKSTNLYTVNVTGFTDLVCGDCGQTVVSDVYDEKNYTANQDDEEP